MPNSQKERTKVVKKIKLYNSMMSRKKLNFKKEGIKQNFLRFNKNMISKVIGYDSIYKKLEKIYNKYSKNKRIIEFSSRFFGLARAFEQYRRTHFLSSKSFE